MRGRLPAAGPRPQANFPLSALPLIVFRSSFFRCSFFRHLFFCCSFFCWLRGLGLREQGAAERDERDRDGEGQRHDGEEIAQRDGEALVQVEVLRVAERQDHAAEVRREVLHDERERERALPPGLEQRGGGQRQHHDERQIVRGEHRQHERGPHKRRHGGPAGGEACHDETRRVLEQADAAQRAHHGEDTEQAGERLHVEIAEVRLVGRHEGHGCQSGQGRHEQHRALAREPGDPRGKRAHGSAPTACARHSRRSPVPEHSPRASRSSARDAAPYIPQALPSFETTIGVLRHGGSAQAR